jgi:hypothetical protein
MSDETNIPEFSTEQREYVQKILAEQGKTLVVGKELQTPLQRAEPFRAAGDFPGLRADREAKHALIREYGDRGYGALQLTWQRSERARKADEARVKLEENKRRLGIR